MKWAYSLLAVVLCAPCSAQVDPKIKADYDWIKDPQELPGGVKNIACQPGEIVGKNGAALQAFKLSPLVDASAHPGVAGCSQKGPRPIAWLGGIDLYRQQYRHLHVTDDATKSQTPCSDHGFASPCDMDGIRVCRADAVGGAKKSTPCGTTGPNGCAVCQSWFWPESPN